MQRSSCFCAFSIVATIPFIQQHFQTGEATQVPFARKPAAKLYKSIEYHCFECRGRWLLFDVNALTVLPSSPLDRVILEMAREPVTPTHLTDVVVATGPPRDQVAKRVRELLDQGFLLGTDEIPTLAQVRPPISYITFMLNISQRCNLTCPYCYVNKGLFDYDKKPVARMEAATADEIVTKVHELFPNFETYAYHFYGGEPLMNFDAIRRIVRAADVKAQETRTKTDYHITTNGTLLDKSVADFMDQHRFTVYISVDGDQQIHDELRRYINGRGSFHDVEENLAYLRTRQGIHLIGSSVIRKGFSLGTAIEFLEAQGAHQCKAERARLPSGDVLSLQGPEHVSYVRDIEGLVDHYITYLGSAQKPLDFRLSSKILQLLIRTRRSFFCPAGERMFGISADGELYPCALHVGRQKSKLGDIYTGLDEEKQRGFREKFGPEQQEGCRTCWTRHLCGGGCSAMVDRFGHEDCRAIRAESEAAIAVYQYFTEHNQALLYGLVSPKIAKWVNGQLEDVDELLPTEATIREGSCSCCRNGKLHASPLIQIGR